MPTEQRVAAFDNDGTLWSEQPLYFQFFFLLDQVKAAAPQHPEWRNNPAFKALMANDLAKVIANEKQLLQLIAVANSGMNVDDYDKTIRDVDRQRAPSEVQPALHRSGLPAAAGTAVLPARERVQDLYRVRRDHRVHAAVGGAGVRDSARAGGGLDRRRCTMARLNGKPALVRDPKMEFINDGPGKPVGIYRHIGRRPILAVGNSDGDFHMLEYTTTGDGPRLAVLVHHDDAEREFAYDRASKIGKLDKALDAAQVRNWTVISMKQDWQAVYPKR